MIDVHLAICCGSAQVEWATHGGVMPTPYQGGKAPFAEVILEETRLCAARLTVLFDVGPWPETIAALMDPARRRRIVDMVATSGRADQYALHKRIVNEPISRDADRRVADHLVLQRLSFQRKPVGRKGGRWTHAGVCKTSALGSEKTERGWGVKPLVGQMAKRLPLLPYFEVVAVTGDIQQADLRRWCHGRVQAYGDFPYVGTTGYGKSDLTRDEQLAVAEELDDLGVGTVLSEGAPLPVAGWSTMDITDRKVGKPLKPGRNEWLTCSPGMLAPAQPRLWGAA